MSYVYPFGPKATTGRIDQGQDFGGIGAILAIGDAKVISTGAPGWPGGQGVLYRLLDGPRRGQYIFVYEGIRPAVRAGEVVKAGQKIGSLIPGSSTGIEIGFADAHGVPLSHAEYTEGKETIHGKEMASFLSQLKKGSGSGSGGGVSLSDIAQGIALGPAATVFGGLSGPAGEAVAGAASKVGSEVVSYLANLLGVNASAILLNIGLVGGGAFLVYFGIARAVGIAQPVRGPMRAYKQAAGTAAMVAA